MQGYELAVNPLRTENPSRPAIVELGRAVRLDPDNAEAHLLIGQIYGGSGMYAQAEGPLRRAVTLLRAASVEEPAQSASFGEARNSLAAVLINLQRPAEALPLLLELSRDVYYPQPHLALSNLGQAYLALGRASEAVSALERAVANRAEFCVGHYRLGEAYAGTRDDARASAFLDRASARRGRAAIGSSPRFVSGGRFEPGCTARTTRVRIFPGAASSGQTRRTVARAPSPCAAWKGHRASWSRSDPGFAASASSATSTWSRSRTAPASRCNNSSASKKSATQSCRARSS